MVPLHRISVPFLRPASATVIRMSMHIYLHRNDMNSINPFRSLLNVLILPYLESRATWNISLELRSVQWR